MNKRLFLELCDEKDGVTGTNQLFEAFFSTTVSGAHGPTNNIPFLVDCGTFQGLDNDAQFNSSFFYDVTRPEFAILTHGHLDHYGRFPVAINQGFVAPIFTTHTTANFLTRVFLDDCLKIEKRRNKKTDEDVVPLYSEEDIALLKSMLVPCKYYEKVQYNDNICIYFFDNGHLPGAAVTLVQITDGEDCINVVLSGDYNDHNMFFPVNPLPDWVYKLPNVLILLESTYGGTKTDSSCEPCLVENVVYATKKNMSVLIPTFAFGRHQEVLYTLKQAQDMGTLDRRIPIYADGKSAIATTQIFLEGKFNMFHSAKNFLPDNLIIVEDKAMRRQIISDSITPKIVAASSGSASYGASQAYLNAHYTNPKYMVHSAGHLFPESKLGRMRDDPNAKALFRGTGEFSAHARQEKLVNFVKPFDPKNVLGVGIHHGEEVSKDLLANELINEGYKTFILNSNFKFRFNSSGLVGCFPRYDRKDKHIR